MSDSKYQTQTEYFKETSRPAIFAEMVPGSNSFAIGIGVNAGSRDDFHDFAGLAHFVEHTVFRGTQKRSSKRISSEFESLGAYVNAFTTKEFTCFYVRALNEHFKKVIEILSDLVLNPVFKDKDIEKEKTIIIEEIKSYEDDPEEMIFDTAEELFFADSELAHPIIGKLDSVTATTGQELKQFHRSVFNSDKMLVSFAGSIDFHEIKNSVSKLFCLPETTGSQTFRQVPKETVPFNVELEKEFQQSHIVTGRRVPGITSPERYALAAINVILGDGMSSRLHQILREKHGIVYTVYSSLNVNSDSGLMTIYAGFDKRNTKRIKGYILDEIDKLNRLKISSKELFRAKNQLKSGTLMALESLSARMQSSIKSFFTLGRYETIDETLDKINALEPDYINSVIDSYFNPEEWSSLIFKSE